MRGQIQIVLLFLTVGALALLSGCTSASSVMDKGNLGAQSGTGFMS